MPLRRCGGFVVGCQIREYWQLLAHANTVKQLLVGSTSGSAGYFASWSGYLPPPAHPSIDQGQAALLCDISGWPT
jgi:hypothetical protein